MPLDVAVAAVPVLAMAAIVLSVGVGRFLHDVHSRSQILATDSQKLTNLREHALLALQHPKLLLLVLAILVLAWRRLPLVVVALCVALPFLIIPGGGYGYPSRTPDPYYNGRAPYGGGGYYGYDTAYPNGLRDGVEKGREDARKHRSYDPLRHSWYRSGDHDYHKEYGPKQRYEDIYRQGFKEGYDRGFRELGYR